MKFIYNSSSVPLVHFVLLSTVVSLLLKHAGLVVMASTDGVAFGSLSNFDVFCITEFTEECHGFEIELEGIHCEDITRTFGGTYNRYGSPSTTSMTDIQGNVTGCIVEYSSSYDSDSQTFSSTTIVPPELSSGGRIGTNGHQCYLGGMNAAAYDSSGCEHFGVSLRKSPTKTSYYWLVADSQNQGQLKRDQSVVGVTSVNWSAQNNAGNVVVRAEVEAPEPVFECAKWGDAKWLKVNITELEFETELEDLLSDNQVIVEAESEIEWKILQARPTCDENGQPVAVQPENAFVVEAAAGNSSKTVIRRYEFFEYTGEYEVESHEVIPLVDEDTPQDSEIGNYLGSQMAAINFQDRQAVDPLTITTEALLTPSATSGKPCTYSLEASGGTAPYSWALTDVNQNLPGGLTLDSDGSIQGTLTADPGIYEFSAQVSDSGNSTETRLFQVNVLPGVLAIKTKKLPKMSLNKSYSTQIVATGGTPPLKFSLLKGRLPSGITLTATGMIQGTANAKGKKKFFVLVKDSQGKKKKRRYVVRVK